MVLETCTAATKANVVVELVSGDKGVLMVIQTMMVRRPQI